MEFDKELDARGLNCPLPILRAKKALAEVTSGQVLKILSTDPGSVKDFAAFAKQTGNELLSTAEAGGEFPLFMQKTNASNRNQRSLFSEHTALFF
jgi:tRNA 2-thiouridine synthesizing protein A